MVNAPKRVGARSRAMPERITIANEEIAPGDHAFVDLKIARLPTFTEISIPVQVFRSKEDGPVLLLTGGLHGDEINGIEIVRRMISEKLLGPQKGSIIAIPLVNTYGFIQNVRGVPDGKDINRSFPGIKGGSLARLVAYTLMNQIIPQIDLGLDFHTGGASRANYPQIRADLKNARNREIAQAFAAPFIVHSPHIEKSFRKAAARKDKPILVYESGEAMRLDEEGIEEGIGGALRVMKWLGMIDEAPGGKPPVTMRKTKWQRARRAGIFRTIAQLGDKITKGDIIGSITDPYGTKEVKVRAERGGHIIGLNNQPVLHKGDALYHIGFNS